MGGGGLLLLGLLLLLMCAHSGVRGCVLLLGLGSGEWAGLLGVQHNNKNNIK